MADDVILNATAREGTGKGAARTARREGLVPGVVYGGGEDPSPINVKFNELLKMLKAGRFMSTLLTLKIDGKDQRVICRAVQRDVVKDLPTHVDFLRLSRKSRINLFIPVEFTGEEESPGLSRIPESLTADLSELDVGDTVTISSIELPAGSRAMITDRDFMIANISAPSSLKSADDEEAEDTGEEGAEAPAEGEASEE